MVNIISYSHFISFSIFPNLSAKIKAFDKISLRQKSSMWTLLRKHSYAVISSNKSNVICGLLTKNHLKKIHCPLTVTPSFKRFASPLDSLFEIGCLFRRNIIFLLNTIILKDIFVLFYGTFDIFVLKSLVSH